MGGSVDPTGLTATDVTDYQLDSPTDGQVRPIAVAQNVDPGVHSDPLGDRSVHDEHRTDTHRGGQHPVHVEFVSADCLQRGQHHRQVFGSASSHYRVHGHLLDCALDE